MGDVAVRVDGLGKMFRIGGKQASYNTFRDTLADAVIAPFRRAGRVLRGQSYGASDLTETIWALKDVSFEVKRGEVIGIIGRNGAGKSTLLKILSRITEPTEGKAQIYGRVGALLEVGTGFHPELTGRENIFLNGAILGMSRTEINRKFDEIVAFAEVEKFIDTPVKHYSSGMGLRLGFAVAAHMEPEILIVDEVLAVGDAAFQKKCLGKMGEVAGEGRTVLFVSHNMVAIQSLCSYIFWLEEGQVKSAGPTKTIISDYLIGSANILTERCWPDINTAPGNEKLRIHSLRVKADSENMPLTIESTFDVEIEYWNLESGSILNLSVQVENEEGILVFNTATLHEPNWNGHAFVAGLYRSTGTILGNLLNNGIYKFNVLFVKNTHHLVFQFDGAIFVEILDSDAARGGWHGNWPGVVRPLLNWKTEQVSDTKCNNSQEVKDGAI